MPPDAPDVCYFLTWLIQLDATGRNRFVGLAMLGLLTVLYMNSCRVNTDVAACIRLMVRCCTGTVYKAQLIVHDV